MRIKRPIMYEINFVCTSNASFTLRGSQFFSTVLQLLQGILEKLYCGCNHFKTIEKKLTLLNLGNFTLVMFFILFLCEQRSNAIKYSDNPQNYISVFVKNAEKIACYAGYRHLAQMGLKNKPKYIIIIIYAQIILQLTLNYLFFEFGMSEYSCNNCESDYMGTYDVQHTIVQG